MQFISRKTYCFICLIIVLLMVGSYVFFGYKRNTILDRIYTKQSIEMNDEIEHFIKQKQGITAAITFLISRDKTITEALLRNDPSPMDYQEIIKGLTTFSEYKNIWIHIIDRKGNSFYRSWLPKRGDYVAQVRKDVALMLEDPQPMSHLSTGKFDMSFKTMLPIFDNGTLIGIVEMITHFNSIAKKLQKRSIEPLILVEKKYTRQFIKPFSNLFVGENYVANRGASKELMEKVEHSGVESFFSIKKYRILDRYLVTTYNIPDIKGQPMGHAVLFYPINLVDISDLKTFELYFSLFIIALVIVVTALISRYFLVKQANDLLQFNRSLQQERNRARQSEKAKSEFLANMSHEIRTPLNAILGFVFLLTEQETNPEKLNYLKTIDSSSQSLLAIINDILDSSKIESGKVEIDIVSFQTHKEFESIGQLFQAQCSRKNITFEYMVTPDVPLYLKSDPLKLRQIISNLLSNAVKFTDPMGKIFFQVDYWDGYLQIIVRDNGIGVPEDRQSVIFDAFSQADNSTTRKYGGTGLGLTISAAFIKLLNGKITLNSKEGEGSTFELSIPAALADAPSVRYENIHLQKGAGGTILVVEDVEANRYLIEILLINIGYTVEFASDGLEAIDKFKENRYFAVFMDENMPNMGGIEATIKIREFEKEKNLPRTPIIALTANAMKGDRERFLRAEMDEYLAKPISVEGLKKVLNKIIVR